MKNRLRRRKFFRTIREAAAVLAASALLSSLLPHVLGNTEDPNLKSAKSSCERVKAAIQQFAIDTGSYPEVSSNGDSIEWLVGPGEVPSNFSVANGSAYPLKQLLAVERTEGRRGYDGPYLQFGGSDIWGRSIVANVAGSLGPNKRIWVLSAGPNGIIETATDDLETQGDDVGVLLPKRANLRSAAK